MSEGDYNYDDDCDWNNTPVDPGIRMAALEPLSDPTAQFLVSIDGHEFLDETSERLYREAEALFFELLKASKVLSGDATSIEDDYSDRFHYLFFRFIHGKLKPKEVENSEFHAATIKRKHTEMIQEPYVNNLYHHCQTRIIAYMLKIKVIASEAEYITGKNYSDVFQALSTGLLSLKAQERLLSGPPASEPPVEFPDAADEFPETAVASTGTSVEVAIALAS